MDMKGNGLRESLLSGNWSSNEDPPEEEICETLINENILEYGNGYPIASRIAGKIFKMGKVGYGQSKDIKLEGWKDYGSTGRLVMKRSSGSLTTNDGVPLTLKLFALKQVVDEKREPVKLCIVRLLSDKALKRRANGSNPEKKSTKRRKTAKNQPASSALVKIKSQPLSPVSPDTVSRSPVHSPMNSPPVVGSPSPNLQPVPDVQSVPVHYHSPLSSPMGSPVPSLMMGSPVSSLMVGSPAPSLMEPPAPPLMGHSHSQPSWSPIVTYEWNMVPSTVEIPPTGDPLGSLLVDYTTLSSSSIHVDISYPDTSPPLAKHDVPCGYPPIGAYQLPFDSQQIADNLYSEFGISLLSSEPDKYTNASSLVQEAFF